MARLAQAKAARGGRPWTSDAQRDWLMDQMGGYMEARNSKRCGALGAFRRKVMDDFILEFWKNMKTSEVERTDALETLEWCIREWFSNHSRKAGPVRGTKILDLRGTKKKCLAAWQAYSCLYYDDILKPLVEEQWREDPLYDPNAHEVLFKFRNNVVYQLWRIEKDEEVKEKVAAYIEEVYQRGNNTEEEDDIDDNDDDNIEPEELSRRQANRKLQTQVEVLPLTLQKMCKQIRRELGFVSVVCFTGPEPKSGGSIVTAFSANGRTEGGRMLTEVYPSLRAQLEAAVCDFASKAIPIEERVACSLLGTESKCDYVVPSISLDSTTPPTTATMSKSAPSRS
ncbi:hypothetical protein BDN71DRAFT_1504115 [Pleurotus eryngii]|uniref:Uncharacterized protein n=1 Tax=Pleurotus eryngii TaxID=5323 RepID=A0A9P6A3N2_PLEER|nr:hypothetical protein BDN71DRAFT_1504115 [Pleurotus eryngii]